MFQSTHPCGVRPVDSICGNSGVCFNPRTRVGCDINSFENQTKLAVSIHAPVWGATVQGSVSIYTVKVSIHAPVWGAT
ncbi:hypothetical protein ACYT6K_10275, partial [Streptococcus pyogenes]